MDITRRQFVRLCGGTAAVVAAFRAHPLRRPASGPRTDRGRRVEEGARGRRPSGRDQPRRDVRGRAGRPEPHPDDRRRRSGDQGGPGRVALRILAGACTGEGGHRVQRPGPEERRLGVRRQPRPQRGRGGRGGRTGVRPGGKGRADGARARSGWSRNPCTWTPGSRPTRKTPSRCRSTRKVALLLRINEEVRRNPQTDRGPSPGSTSGTRTRFYANSEGAEIQQRLVRSDGSFFARAHVDGVTAQRRFFVNPLNIGYEYIRGLDLPSHAERIAAEAVEKAKAPLIDFSGQMDVVMDPQNLCLFEHETIGHPTELNRTVLVETNFRRQHLPWPRGHGELRVRLPGHELRGRPQPPHAPLHLRLRRRRRQDAGVGRSPGGEAGRLPDHAGVRHLRG